MSLKGKLLIPITVCALFGAQPGGLLAQSTYYFTAPLNGYQEIPFCDVAGNEPGNTGPGTSPDANFGTVSGTIIYNPSASTVEMQGNIAINYSSSVSFNDPHNVNGSFTPAMVSISYSIGNLNNGVFSFDTGSVEGSNPGGVPVSLNVPIPISGTYGFTTGGQTYNGTFGYTLMLNTLFQLQSLNSTAMTFTMDDALEYGGGHLQTPLANITAANGLQMNLYALDPSDGVTYYNWQLNNVTASAPEPGTLTLLSIGGVGLFLSIRRKAKATKQ